MVQLIVVICFNWSWFSASARQRRLLLLRRCACYVWTKISRFNYCVSEEKTESAYMQCLSSA